jgi:hypothetical protein
MDNANANVIVAPGTGTKAIEKLQMNATQGASTLDNKQQTKTNQKQARGLPLARTTHPIRARAPCVAFETHRT